MRLGHTTMDVSVVRMKGSSQRRMARAVYDPPNAAPKSRLKWMRGGRRSATSAAPNPGMASTRGERRTRATPATRRSVTLGTMRVRSPPAGRSIAIAMLASPAHRNATSSSTPSSGDEPSPLSSTQMFSTRNGASPKVSVLNEIFLIRPGGLYWFMMGSTASLTWGTGGGRVG